MMHSLRHLGIPTAAVVLLIALSILALVGIGEGFKLLAVRSQHYEKSEAQKRDGAFVKFTFPWEWTPPEMTAVPAATAREVVRPQDSDIISKSSPIVSASLDITSEAIYNLLAAAQSTHVAVSTSYSAPTPIPALAANTVSVSPSTSAQCSTCSAVSSAQTSLVAAVTELCTNNTKPSVSGVVNALTSVPLPISTFGICPTETRYSTVSACTSTSISFVAAMTVTKSCAAGASAAIAASPSGHPCPNAGYSCAECPDGWFCPPVQTSARACPCGYGWPCVNCVKGWYCIPAPTNIGGGVCSTTSSLASSPNLACNTVPISTGSNTITPKPTILCRDGSLVKSMADCLMATATVYATTSVSSFIAGSTIIGSIAQSGPYTFTSSSQATPTHILPLITSSSLSALSISSGSASLIAVSSGVTGTPSVSVPKPLTTNPPSLGIGDLSSMVGNVLTGTSNTCNGAIPCLISELTALAGQVGGQATGIVGSLEGNVASAIADGGTLVTNILEGVSLPNGEANPINSIVGGILGQLAASLAAAANTQLGPAIGSVEGNTASTVSAVGVLVNSIAGSVPLPTAGANLINPIAGAILSQLAASLVALDTQIGPAVAGAPSQILSPLAASTVAGITQPNPAIAGATNQAQPLISNAATNIPIEGGILSPVRGGINSIPPQTIHTAGLPVRRSPTPQSTTTTSSDILNITASSAVDVLVTTPSTPARAPMSASTGFRRVKRRVDLNRPPAEAVYGWGQDLSMCHEGPRGLECAVKTRSTFTR